MITGLYAGLCGLLFIWLSWKVVVERQRSKVGLGDGGDPDLQRAIRVHANFIEYTPLALVLLALAEMSGMADAVVHGFGIALVIVRVLHAQGLGATAGYSRGRYFGTLGTWLIIIGLSLLLVVTTLRSFG
ncbi:MAG: MAPEG family protein [Gammaproteobacteria bacterium]